MDRRYVVTNDAGIPFGNQTAMTREEAEAWIGNDKHEEYNSASWNYTELHEYLAGGGEIVKRGWECSNCGFFRRKKYGKSRFCECCGKPINNWEEE